MLTIIKIQEGYCVIDLDEDTQLFDSLEEAQNIAGSIISEARSYHNKKKKYDKKFNSQREKTKNSFNFPYQRIRAKEAGQIAAGEKSKETRDDWKKAGKEYKDEYKHILKYNIIDRQNKLSYKDKSKMEINKKINKKQLN